MPAAHSPRRLALVALTCAGALVIGLSGCTTDAPEPTPSPSASADAPIFASDEEALAAAEAAYAAYLAALDLVGSTGGNSLAALDPVVNPEFREEVDASFAGMQQAGVRTTGATAFTVDRLAESSQTGEIAEVSIYACLDVTDVRVLDAAGADVTPAERPAVTPYLVRFTSKKPGDVSLIVSGSEAWRGDDFCA